MGMAKNLLLAQADSQVETTGSATVTAFGWETAQLLICLFLCCGQMITLSKELSGELEQVRDLQDHLLTGECANVVCLFGGLFVFSGADHRA